MKLRKRLKKRKRLKLKSRPTLNVNTLTGYSARVDPVCTVCKGHKPLNWWVKACADVTCKGRYKASKRRLIKNEAK